METDQAIPAYCLNIVGAEPCMDDTSLVIENTQLGPDEAVDAPESAASGEADSEKLLVMQMLSLPHSVMERSRLSLP